MAAGVVVTGLLAGCSTSGTTSTAPPASTDAPRSSPNAASSFSVNFTTAPCFGSTWTRVTGDRWAIRDSVTSKVIDRAGTAYQGRCGFAVQFHLPANTFEQYAQVYVYDPAEQLAGLNQSNGGDAHVLVAGNGGPYAFSKNTVLTGPTLTDCTALPTACGQATPSTPGSSAAPAGYRQYANPRYGFTTLWPTSLTEQPPPENGDGREWTRDGGTVSMSAYGSNNINADTPAEDLRAISSGLRVTYSIITGNIVTISGYKNDAIVYERDVVGASSIDTLLWQYPSAQRDTWQAATTKTALTFTAGDVSSSH
jgi:hypothetical protein